MEKIHNKLLADYDSNHIVMVCPAMHDRFFYFEDIKKLIKTLKPHYCLVTGIENSHIGNFRNFNHLIDNKLKIFKSKRLISGLINYNYNPHYIQSKINSNVHIINADNLKKNIQKIFL